MGTIMACILAAQEEPRVSPLVVVAGAPVTWPTPPLRQTPPLTWPPRRRTGPPITVQPVAAREALIGGSLATVQGGRAKRGEGIEVDPAVRWPARWA